MDPSSELLPLLSDANERFRTIRELGSGTYGRVMLAFDRDLQQRCALKVLQKSTTKYRDFQREYNYSLSLTGHRSIINIYEDRCFQTTDAYVIVQEYAPLGDLFESIPPQRGLPERAVKTIMKQVASALEFMHDKGLVSRLFRRRLTRRRLITLQPSTSVKRGDTQTSSKRFQRIHRHRGVHVQQIRTSGKNVFSSTHPSRTEKRRKQ